MHTWKFQEPNFVDATRWHGSWVCVFERKRFVFDEDRTQAWRTQGPCDMHVVINKRLGMFSSVRVQR